ncbi:hypothetical protein FQA39_LY15406 [Lamprigera yunnana]|nr:hypothetical protein FQA39_LY15406 [Lamprigera yunnana]
MDEYPNEDEEFELMYGDELELFRIQEDQKEIPIQNRFEKPNVSQNETVIIADDKSEEVVEASASKKRTIEDLFGEIDDILSEEHTGFRKKPKNIHEDEFAVIEHILELRRLASERHNSIVMYNKARSRINMYSIKDNLSYDVPKYLSVDVTRFDGRKVYVRCHSEKFMQEESDKITNSRTFTECMGERFKDVWKEAELLINNQLDASSMENGEQMEIDESSLNENKENSAQLWVDLYRPQRYLELLSDESTNRTLLKWFKLWDKIVFNRRPKAKLKKDAKNFQNKYSQEFNLKLDDTGRPQYKVALLCGPPGLGKTTLAHIVAKHAGYNVVEVNASDDRSIETFKRILENSTQMSSVLDINQRPNCLIFDEIDGAPSTSVDFLIKYITGTSTGKRKKKGSQNSVLKRPIVCICNDLYVPALRALRQIAFIVNFPPTASVRLAERLQEISRQQRINIDMGALLALCGKTGNDIRSCLSVLHFFQSLQKPVTLSFVNKTKIGQKDMQKGLFAVWQDIFQFQYPKADNQTNEETNHDNNLKNRTQKVLKVVHAFGDYERLIQGIFENYVKLNLKDSTMLGICKASEWFCFTDLIYNQIHTLQNYNLASYVQYGFLIWHFLFATTVWQKLSYPSVGYEVKTKLIKQNGLLEEVIKGMKPCIRAFTSVNPLRMDVLPILSDIITPTFRPVNIHLYTPQEKNQLSYIVSIMINYNLNYVQERVPEGHFVYSIDPNIDEIVSFLNIGKRRILPYSIKQLIAREIELEKMRDIEKGMCGKADGEKKKPDAIKSAPNHLQNLKSQPVKDKLKGMVSKDFFGRVINTPTNTSRAELDLKHDLWYQFKEGYNNAVRKKVKVSSLK